MKALILILAISSIASAEYDPFAAAPNAYQLPAPTYQPPRVRHYAIPGNSGIQTGTTTTYENGTTYFQNYGNSGVQTGIITPGGTQVFGR